MPSHFSTIGLPVASEDELFELAERIADLCASLPVDRGQYLVWESGNGAEVWLQVDSEDQLVGITPHFSGESRVRVGLTARVARPEDTGLDGAFRGWADPDGADPESGAYPFVFDAPDFRRHDALSLPAVVTARVAAFAHEVSLFASEAEFAASQAEGPQFASRSFIPLEGDAEDPPESMALFTGHVLRAEVRVNPLTDRPFHWALVETLGGRFDVVMDPEVPDRAPVAGDILSGVFWLSGRIVPDDA